MSASILGVCDRWRDSKKPASSLTLSLTCGGVFTGADSSVPISTVTTYAETTRTFTLTRDTFDPRAFYNGATLDADKFWMVSKCCCWKCRFQLFQLGLSPGQIAPVTAFSFPWSSVTTGGDGGTDSGDDTASCLASLAFEESHLIRCSSASESGSKGLAVAMLATPPAPFFSEGIGWTYTDSEGSTDTGTTTAGHSPFTLPGESAYGSPRADTCADSQDWWAQIVLDGSHTVGTNTQTVSAATIRLDLSVS